MAKADLATRIAYRQLIYSETPPAIAYVLACSDEVAKDKLRALYAEEMLLAFADAGADTKAPIKHVIAYLLFTESDRALKAISGVSRLLSQDARDKYRDYKKLFEAGTKLMATYVEGPVDQEIYGMFLTIAQAYWFEHSAAAMRQR
jgi:hypothetical protein